MSISSASKGLLTALMVASGLIATGAPQAQAQDRSLWLHNGDYTTVSGYLIAGESVYGECDQDCADLDLFLYDAVSGELVYEDSAIDAVPFVTAPWDGDFIVEVVMPDCAHPEGCAVWLSSDYGF
ncbi:hypothetical protein C7271_08025 [filamentous cyanobacterium CCP5]|nr:hypothetical protein C7293_31385 [filamentous cyanobacterium CCT1]PSN19306.1 hypothetical protein C7271_08025 [filamentous cyanobacterium CCP5]